MHSFINIFHLEWKPHLPWPRVPSMTCSMPFASPIPLQPHSFPCSQQARSYLPQGLCMRWFPSAWSAFPPDMTLSIFNSLFTLFEAALTIPFTIISHLCIPDPPFPAFPLHRTHHTQNLSNKLHNHELIASPSSTRLCAA